MRPEASKLTSRHFNFCMTTLGQAMASTTHGSHNHASSRATAKAGSQHVARFEARDMQVHQQQSQKLMMRPSSVQ